MIKGRVALKRIISVFVSFVTIISSICLMNIQIYAKENVTPVYPFVSQDLPNGYGYWADIWYGLRFSLIDKYGNTEKKVDVFNLENSITVSQGICGMSVGAGGKIGNILKGNGAIPNYAPIQFRVFNNSKFEVAKSTISELKSSCSYNPILIVDKEDYDYDRLTHTWYCADARTVFQHIPNNGINDYNNNLFDFYFGGVGNDVWAQTDGVDEFICNKLTGNNRNTLDNDTFNPNSNTWIGMCDLLYALGKNVYYDDESNKENNKKLLDDLNNTENKWKIYNNLINEFVIPEYCVIVEPIMFITVPLCTCEINETGNWYVSSCRIAVYYGSMTELGILESNAWVHPDDWGYISKTDYSGLNQREFTTLHAGKIARGVGQQCAWVTEDYQYDIDKYMGDDVLKTVSVDNYIEWYKYRSKYNPDTSSKPRAEQIDSEGYVIGDGTFTAYTEDVIKRYTTGMSIITSSDFIKPQVETYDSEYRTDTNVVTSVKLSNRSDTDYSTIIKSDNISSNTSLNKNGVPKAMLCKFTVSKISDDSGEVGRWTADRSSVTTQFQQKVEELGFEKDESGNYITEFYGSLDGLLPREITNANAPCYVSFNWKTPKEPCKVTFEVEFLNANSNPEPVLGTDEHDGLRATEMDEDMRNIYGKYITYFDCDIAEGENTTYFTEATVPPDSVSIISVAPNAAEGTEEQKLYKLNHDIYDAYQAAHGTTPAVYTGTDFAGKTIVDSQSWSEYVASYDASNNIVLTHKPHNVSIGLSKTTDDTYTDSTTKILRTDQSGLYSDYADTIGSGYGIGVDFISSYSNDEAGVDYIRDVTVNGVTYQNSLVTNYDHGVVMFPEYNYQTYYGELLQFDTDVDLGGRSAEKRFMFTASKDSKFYGDAVDRPAGMSDEEYAEYDEMNRNEKSRVHFTPVWYPDGKYQIVMCMFDAWTPAGELWFYKTYDIEIKGSIYDTWYVTRTYKNQVAS